MTSQAVLETLEHVTKVKLDKLASQQKAFEKRKAAIFDAVEQRSDPVERNRYLLNAIEYARGGDLDNDEYENIEKLLYQAESDRSIPLSKLKEWEETLKKDFDWQSERYRFTDLFGRLVTERIQNPNEVSRFKTNGSDSDNDSDKEGSAFEVVGREEMHEQRKEWESYVFREPPDNSEAIKQYLDSLFVSTKKGKKTKKTPLEVLQEDIGKLEDIHEYGANVILRFDGDSVKQAIDGLLKADLFAGEKRNALINLRSQKRVLNEIADVLNTDLDNIDDWEWESTPVPVSVRRQIHGKYRFYLDEDITQAIFLQWIGAQWAVHLRRGFVKFFHSGAWTQASFNAPTKKDIRRREHFLGESANWRGDSVRNERRKVYSEDFFMTQLPSSLRQQNREYGVDDDSSIDEDTDQMKTPLEIKQSLLALATTERLINNHIYGKFCVVQSDFKWFGPSLPHSTIFAVLKYFGVPERWLNFFKKFLRTPMAFPQDGEDSEGRVRSCGIPMVHVLADAMGEAVLFVLDFAVNQKTGGADLYRFHDDLWFWGQPDSCVEAWKALTEFSDIMGLSLNEEKTGACIAFSDSRPGTLPEGLPLGDVRWGFLRMEPGSGNWVVDENQIKEHTEEFKRQLLACRSTLAYIRAYNAYMSRFFLNNLGEAKICHGRAHVEMCIRTISSIEKDLFSSGTIGDHLKQMIRDRFGVEDVPDGFIFFPIELGGVGARNALIPLIRKIHHPKDPNDKKSAVLHLMEPLEVLQYAYELEEEQYEEDKKKYDEGKVKNSGQSPAGLPDDEPFMSLEEYMKFREERSSKLLDKYKALQRDILPVTLDESRWWKNAKHQVSRGRDPDQHWIMELYGQEIEHRFGKLCMGEKDLLPIGLVDMLSSEKVRWQG